MEYIGENMEYIINFYEFYEFNIAGRNFRP